MLPLYITFVIRLQLDEQHSIVSGQISHVGTQETTYFRDLDRAMTYIKEYLANAVIPQDGDHLSGLAIIPEQDADDANRH